MPSTSTIHLALDEFKNHYSERFEDAEVRSVIHDDGTSRCYLQSDKLKEGNSPRIFHHNKKTEDVVVLTHGLSDSPHYLEAVALRFLNIGVNVFLTLLPAHGLKQPNEAMEDFKMDKKWRHEIDHAVKLAQHLGQRISLAGFSTGGALSYNKILRDKDSIKGGLFLFSGAIEVKFIDALGKSFLIQSISKKIDGNIEGYGQDPYKYPKLPNFAALELGQVIDENEDLRGDVKISQPVFAAHSVHDTTARIGAIVQLLKDHAQSGLAFVISDNVNHAEIPLKDAIVPDLSFSGGHGAKANPQFDRMMDACIDFFECRVQEKAKTMV